MLFGLPALFVRVAEMGNEHFSLVVKLLNFGPTKVLRFATGRKRIDAAMIDAQIELRPSVILDAQIKVLLINTHTKNPCDFICCDSMMCYPNLDRMRINAIRFQFPCDCHKLIDSQVRLLALLAFLMQLNDFVVELLGLSQH